jgi:predicted RNase H-like nuclease
LKVPAVADVLSNVRATVPTSDDQLDARVAYALGRLWLDDPASVALLGDADNGSFLVPRLPGLEKAFRSFADTQSGVDAQTSGMSL